MAAAKKKAAKKASTKPPEAAEAEAVLEETEADPVLDLARDIFARFAARTAFKAPVAKLEETAVCSFVAAEAFYKVAANR